MRALMGTDLSTRVCLSTSPSVKACHNLNIRPISESIRLENLTPAAMLQSFEVSDNVSPADLAQTFVKGIVGAEYVRTEYS